MDALKTKGPLESRLVAWESLCGHVLAVPRGRGVYSSIITCNHQGLAVGWEVGWGGVSRGRYRGPPDDIIGTEGN